MLSNKRGTRQWLLDFSSGRRSGVDDVECLSKAEILVRDEVHGRRSRSQRVAFEGPKAVEASGEGRNLLVRMGCWHEKLPGLGASEGWCRRENEKSSLSLCEKFKRGERESADVD